MSSEKPANALARLTPACGPRHHAPGRSRAARDSHAPRVTVTRGTANLRLQTRNSKPRNPLLYWPLSPTALRTPRLLYFVCASAATALSLAQTRPSSSPPPHPPLTWLSLSLPPPPPPPPLPPSFALFLSLSHRLSLCVSLSSSLSLSLSLSHPLTNSLHTHTQ